MQPISFPAKLRIGRLRSKCNKEYPEEVIGIADDEFNSENLKLNSININETDKQGYTYKVEAKYSKTFSNGKKVIYILKFYDDFDVFDDVFYTENKGE